MDELERFAATFLDEMPVIGCVPLRGAVSYVEGVAAVLLYRQGQFQVQMFIVPPHYVIPAHVHPNVDSIEVYMGGDIGFTLNGAPAPGSDLRHEVDELGCSQSRGGTVRVRPSDRHGAVFGPGGGVFLSIQRWLNGVRPHCVAADYEGVVMGPDHLSKVVHGCATLKAELVAADAS